MVRMIIRMNEEKILRENQYDIDDIYRVLHEVCEEEGLIEEEGEKNEIIYRGCGDDKDLARVFLATEGLDSADWFLDNCSYWHVVDDNEDEDWLAHYLSKREREHTK